MTVRNVHERTVDAPAETVGALLDRIGTASDPLWPAPAWMPMRLDRPLGVGADGGHGPIRYQVSEYEPGRRVRFEFHRSAGISGYHELVIEPVDADRCVVRHVLEGEPKGVTKVVWPTAVRWLHDAVLEDLLDNAECSATGRPPANPARWSPWVRVLRQRMLDPARSVPPPRTLAQAALPSVDFADAWQVPRPDRVSDDPQVWADAIFREPPAWLDGVMKVRAGIVERIGIDSGDESDFDTITRTDDEVLLGADAGHLDFRASVLVRDGAVTVTTVVHVKNLRGRLYWAAVSRVHPFAVAAILHDAALRLRERAPKAASGTVGV